MVRREWSVRIVLLTLVAGWSAIAWGQGFTPAGQGFAPAVSVPPVMPQETRPPASEPTHIPLPPHKADNSAHTDGLQKAERIPHSSTPSIATVTGMLVVVVGLFLVMAWGMRRTMPGQVATLPKEVVDVLGRAALASRQQVYLLRCGAKLLLVSATPSGVETLTEIVDPAEVDRLLGLCVQSRPDSTTAAFRQFFQQFGREDRHG